METAFTPWTSLAGGALIGLAATLLMLVSGRIMGATGILAGVLWPEGVREFAWRATLIAGMVSAPGIVWLTTGRMPVVEVPVTPMALVVGGLLVGVGVTYGGGCTSGHGVCGLARFSPRSLVATATFMVATLGTVFVVRHVVGG